MKNKYDFMEVLHAWGIDAGMSRINEFKRGHINDSFVVEATGTGSLFLQRINHHVFRDPPALMDNLSRLSRALDRHYGGKEKNPYPGLIHDADGAPFYRDSRGNYWRLMEFVDGSRSFNIASGPEVAREGAAAFGDFQLVMNAEDPNDYVTVIPAFHHLGARLEKLMTAIGNDESGRADMARAEIRFALERSDHGTKLEELLAGGRIPLRVTHNDTKLNNVLFEENRTRYICVVDLDTVMPGTVLYDYGDMVRTYVSPAEEDEPDPRKVVFREEIFEALTAGYLGKVGRGLTAGEKENLLFGARIMLLMIGVRFLTDFLEGDHYFKTARENHNLDRCRNQFILLRQLEEKEDRLSGIIRKYIT